MLASLILSYLCIGFRRHFSSFSCRLPFPFPFRLFLSFLPFLFPITFSHSSLHSLLSFLFLIFSHSFSPFLFPIPFPVSLFPFPLSFPCLFSIFIFICLSPLRSQILLSLFAACWLLLTIAVGPVASTEPQTTLPPAALPSRPR